MKAILEFDLPEEREDFRMATQAVDYYLVIHDLFGEIRSALKHGCGEFADRDEDTLEAVREWLFASMEERNLPLD